MDTGTIVPIITTATGAKPIRTQILPLWPGLTAGPFCDLPLRRARENPKLPLFQGAPDDRLRSQCACENPSNLIRLIPAKGWTTCQTQS